MSNNPPIGVIIPIHLTVSPSHILLTDMIMIEPENINKPINMILNAKLSGLVLNLLCNEERISNANPWYTMYLTAVSNALR
jgi:hypothetical protein